MREWLQEQRLLMAEGRVHDAEQAAMQAARPVDVLAAEGQATAGGLSAQSPTASTYASHVEAETARRSRWAKELDDVRRRRIADHER